MKKSRVFPKVHWSRKKMVSGVSYLQEYFSTYVSQESYEGYSKKVLIDDTLYALGVVLDPDEYRFCSGFEQFKKDLMVYLKENIS